MCLTRRTRGSLRQSVQMGGQNIKEDINCLSKEHKSIYFDKDQMCFR